MKQNEANANTIRATIEKKTIRAPFAGRLGIRQVNLGQYLDTGKPIVSLQSLDAGVCRFLHAAAGTGQAQNRHARAVATDTYPEHNLKGGLTAINPDLDA